MKVLTHRFTRVLAVGFAVLALAAPVASARPASRDATPALPVLIEPDTGPVVQSVDDGFDWGSAAIGAGVAGGLLLLVSVGGLSYRHRHDDIGIVH